MKALTNKKLLVLAVGAVLSLAACGQPAHSTGLSSSTPAESSAQPSSEEPGVKYVRGDDEKIYNDTLKYYEVLVEEAHKIYNDNQRYVAYAKAEAELLANAIMVPTYTQGGTYAITRAAPKTISAAVHGLDSDRLQYLVAAKGTDKTSFTTKEQRDAMKAKWQEAFDAGDSSIYDAKAMMEGYNFTIADEYVTTTSAWPQTGDVLATYRVADTEPACNGIEGLVEYDNVGVLRGALAEEDAETGLPYSVSEDGKTYTFKIKEGLWWVDNQGTKKAPVTADDFVAGMQHALDAQGGLEYLVDGVIEGAAEYLRQKTTDFSKVGVRAKSTYELEIKLVKRESYFPSRLVYSVYMPMNREFFLSKGGAFGVKEFAAAAKLDAYKYGIPNDVTSILYNSAFYGSKWETTDNSGEMVYTKNPFFYNAEKVNFNKVQFIYDDGSNPQESWNQTLAGKFVGIGVTQSSGNLERAKNESFGQSNLFDACSYVSDTNATTYFGALNLNRGAWSLEDGTVASNQSEEQKILNHEAFNNLNFRRGFLHGFDRSSWNDVRVGEGAGKFGLRNMYTYPDFVKLSAETTVGDKTFAANTSYGELVEYYINEIGGETQLVKTTADGQDGWFNLALAKKELAAAKEELGEAWPAGQKVVIDKVYYVNSKAQVSQAQAFKQFIEKNIGDYVSINLIEAKTTAEYYYSGYYVETGHELPQDFFDGSGWGPDYLDPGTYLDTYSAVRDASMMKVSGLDM